MLYYLCQIKRLYFLSCFLQGKGKMLTYFLESEDQKLQHRSLSEYKKGHRCVSSSNLDYSDSLIRNRHSHQVSSTHKGNHSLPQTRSWTSSTVSLPPPQSSFPQTPLKPQQCTPQHQQHNSEKSTSEALINPNISNDNTVTNLLEDPVANPFNSDQQSNSNSLARPSIMRQSSTSNMSPIAEDPFAIKSQSKPYEWTQRLSMRGLSKSSTVSSENDDLLSSHMMTNSGIFPSSKKRGSENSMTALNTNSGSEKLFNPETVL